MNGAGAVVSVGENEWNIFRCVRLEEIKRASIRSTFAHPAMNPIRFVNYYCERRGPGLLGEPLNASLNISFFVAAFAGYRPIRYDKELTMSPVLCISLAVVGLGSMLFHTAAAELTGWVDTFSCTCTARCATSCTCTKW